MLFAIFRERVLVLLMFGINFSLLIYLLFNSLSFFFFFNLGLLFFSNRSVRGDAPSPPPLVLTPWLVYKGTAARKASWQWRSHSSFKRIPIILFFRCVPLLRVKKGIETKVPIIRCDLVRVC